MGRFKEKAKALILKHLELMKVEKQLNDETVHDPSKVIYLEKKWAVLQAEEDELLDELVGLDI